MPNNEVDETGERKRGSDINARRGAERLVPLLSPQGGRPQCARSTQIKKKKKNRPIPTPREVPHRQAPLASRCENGKKAMKWRRWHHLQNERAAPCLSPRQTA
ncbi:hypothetical protein TRVL_01263 [Trypanosoma vivax]|nr:hypothetical protein TRVL_01263 [Trypanosoma vivax]